jgi:sulfoxide reductase heme-binding subunit YedZ
VIATVAWDTARAGGVVAFCLLTVCVLVGLLQAGRPRFERWPHIALEDVHRFAGVLAGSFLVVHVGALLLDGYVPFSLADVLIPGHAAYRPLPTALGVVAVELLLALGVTNRFRSLLPYRVWRRVHYVAFAVWALALVHGLTVGSDRSSAWALGMYAAASASVAGLAAWRVLSRRDQSAARRGRVVPAAPAMSARARRFASPGRAARS